MTTPGAAGFTVSPGGSFDVVLERGGNVGYPGVQLRNTGTGPPPLQDVMVTLPAAGELQFEPEARSDACLLTVMSAGGDPVTYTGDLSADRRALAFTSVDLGVPGSGSTAAMFVGVSASPDAPPGSTSLQFTVGDQVSPSTPVSVA